ncbi:hypothetical protein [Streptomyces sp. H27-H5]|uniref:hypothetical protein n=1 Tax=Streptomyces sp. H27-H5 TaxID=2996460 RepID=UPI00226F23EA|nr:hypothetical protein [Streptomyces sp. H27-H5]MCY0962801.1 hypothetical protein [Streptomyces sp. H27-H5]
MTTPAMQALIVARRDADATLARASEEAKEAAGLLTALEDRVRDGDDSITPEELTKARELGSFAQLRTDATRKRVVEARQTARLAALAELKGEMDAYQAEADTGELVDNILAALLAFTQHYESHNAHVNDWAARMKELGVASVPGPQFTQPEDGHLGLNGRDVYTGTAIYQTIDGRGLLDHTVTQLTVAARYPTRNPDPTRARLAHGDQAEVVNKLKRGAAQGVRRVER